MRNKIICGNSSEVLSTLESESVDMVLTSPPYDKLRDYDGYCLDFSNIAQQLYRVLKPGGVVVWVVGDAVEKGSETGTSFKQALEFKEIGFNLHDTMIYEKNGSSFPARRTGNRYSQIFEYMFVFTKGKPKTAKLICDKANRWTGWKNYGKKSNRNPKTGNLDVVKDMAPVPDYSPRNNIWRYNTGGGFSSTDKLAKQHPAIFPEGLAEDCIRTWSTVGDTVLDCFNGSGTTCKVSKSLGRNYIGIDISEKYCELARQRVELAEPLSFEKVIPIKDVKFSLTIGSKVRTYECTSNELESLIETLKSIEKVKPNK